MKSDIQVFDYAKEIMTSIPKGVLLTTEANGRTNSMVIGWGTLGTKWGKTVFTVFVRENRFTRSQIDENPQFSINIPADGRLDKNIMKICGSKSGHNIDKFKELNLQTEPPEVISVPAIKQVPLTLECKVIYRQMQDPCAISDDLKKAFYPKDVDSSCPMANKDYHVMYIGEVVASYIVK